MLEVASEQDRVEAWRTRELEEIGFDSSTALQLAMNTSVDLHRARTLRKQGCPLETIARILT